DQIIDKSRDISPLITTWARMDGVVCPGAVAGDPSFFEIRYSGLDPVLDDLNTGFLGEGYYDCNSGDLVNISAQTVYDQNFYPNF
nr:hypothetical protein [Bacteriovoracaceae bacterium]